MIDSEEDVVYVDPRHPRNSATIIAINSDIIAALAEMPLPVSFTDDQFELIAVAAAALPRARRSAFLEAVAGKLPAQPTDGEVRQAIAEMIG